MPMLAEAARYRREAEKCRSRAARTADPAERTEFEDMARQYEALAALAAGLRPPAASLGSVRHVWGGPDRGRKPRST